MKKFSLSLLVLLSSSLFGEGVILLSLLRILLLLLGALAAVFEAFQS